MIGERILHMMDDMEISIKGLSAVTGIRQWEIRDILAGTSKPSRGLLRKIADALGTDVSDLYGRRMDSPYNSRYQINRADLGNTYDAIDEYFRAGAAFC